MHGADGRGTPAGLLALSPLDRSGVVRPSDAERGGYFPGQTIEAGSVLWSLEAPGDHTGPPTVHPDSSDDHPPSPTDRRPLFHDESTPPTGPPMTVPSTDADPGASEPDFEADRQSLVHASFARGASVQGCWEVTSPSSVVPDWRLTIEREDDADSPVDGGRFLDE